MATYNMSVDYSFDTFGDVRSGDEKAAIRQGIVRQIVVTTVQLAYEGVALGPAAQFVAFRPPIAVDVLEAKGDAVFDAGSQYLTPTGPGNQQVGNQVVLIAKTLIAPYEAFVRIVDHDACLEVVKGFCEQAVHVLRCFPGWRRLRHNIHRMFQSIFQSLPFCFNCNSGKS